MNRDNLTDTTERLHKYGLTVADIARDADITREYASMQLSGRRPLTQKVRNAVRARIGDDGLADLMSARKGRR